MTTINADLTALTNVYYNGKDLSELWLNGEKIWPFKWTEVTYIDGTVIKVKKTSITSDDVPNPENIKSVSFANNVVSIGDNVFPMMSSAFTSITIPKSVTYIGKYNFQGNYSRTITMLSPTPPNIVYDTISTTDPGGSTFFDFLTPSSQKAPTIKIPSGSMSAYQSKLSWAQGVIDMNMVSETT